METEPTLNTSPPASAPAKGPARGTTRVDIGAVVAALVPGPKGQALGALAKNGGPALLAAAFLWWTATEDGKATRAAIADMQRDVQALSASVDKLGSRLDVAEEVERRTRGDVVRRLELVESAVSPGGKR